MITKARLTLFAVLVTAAVLPDARADAIFTVTLDTSLLTALPASSAGPFSLAYQLTDGSGSNDANNTATISGIQFGAGGSAGACPSACSAFGGASGDAGSSIVLTDSAFFNAMLQGFTPGDTLSFLVDLTTNVDSGATPDVFSFDLLDGSGGSLPTLDPSGADSLLTVTLDSASPAILAYGSDLGRPANGGVTVSLSAATIGTPKSAVPEPNTVGLLGMSIAALLILRRKRQCV